MKDNLKPIIILSIMLGLAILVLFFGLDEETRKNIISFEDPLKVQQEKEKENTEVEKVETRTIEEIIRDSNDTILNATGIYCKVYKNGFLYKNNIENFGLDFNNQVYTKGEDYYVDLKEKIIYYLNNGKWYKKELTNDITLNKTDYVIPDTYTQMKDEKIDGTNCYVFFDETTNYKYYIKKSTGNFFCMSKQDNEDIYYYQISLKDITINEKIKETAVFK